MQDNHNVVYKLLKRPSQISLSSIRSSVRTSRWLNAVIWAYFIYELWSLNVKKTCRVSKNRSVEIFWPWNVIKKGRKGFPVDYFDFDLVHWSQLFLWSDSFFLKQNIECSILFKNILKSFIHLWLTMVTQSNLLNHPLNILSFWKILKYSGLFPFSIFPRCQCLYTHKEGRTLALQQNWQSSEKSHNFKEKHNI